MGATNIPLPNGWSNKQQSFLYQLAASARVALMNVRRFAGQFWPAQANRSPMISSKPLSTRDSSFSTPVFILLCGLWYMTSALSSNTGKAILNQFRYPITLTFIQFGFIAVYCLLFMSPFVRFSRLRMPTRAIVNNTLPMGLFQVGGHMFSSMAISRIPVSTVHTIKALSPLFTVAAYALLFGVSYTSKTYVSLLPLTIGVMLACSFDVSASDFIGLLCAFGSALVFVSSNIFFKKIMPSNSSGHSTSSHKLDKLNLLLYSSGTAFLLMIPLWIYYDLPLLLAAQAHPDHIAHPRQGHAAPHSVTYYFVMNGTVHFAQNIIAFVILSSTSPVTYSIASLIKRVAVICIAIMWFNQTVHPVQAIGIILTFTGLYMYNNAKGDVEKGEKKMTRVQAARDMMLPTTKSESRLLSGTETPPNEYVSSFVQPDHPPTVTGVPNGSAYSRPRGIPSPNSPISAFNNHVSHTHATKPPSKRESISLRIVSPVDSYPSPPPSLDSPTSHTIPLPDAFLQAHDLGQRTGPVMV
ncbi:TPT-domain-containing protein [Macrolepiota fuliginosa MF-IS2]|uniref:TPT-domain-containing protein n=1 Tax=Macrolepiota fuliginosa MF-IS2 TaxID=1400762 RepID=A0A9P5XRW2_9AGAR|nr:TPT-domain-containing protein [Macrolepiota fuliginosa MF-IS2]